MRAGLFGTTVPEEAFCATLKHDGGAIPVTEKATLPLSALREIGWNLWDPAGLLPVGADWMVQSFIDEYDVYLLHIAHSLTAGWSAEQAVIYLVQAEVEPMGLGLRSTTKESAFSTVIALRTALYP